MKNRYFILSVLFWAIASVCMAVTLPSSSYSSNFAFANSDNESYVSSIGIQITNHAMLSAYAGECDHLREGGYAYQGDVNECFRCCNGISDRIARADCLNLCETPLGMPLGSPLLLLPFIAIYAVIRRRKEETL